MKALWIAAIVFALSAQVQTPSLETADALADESRYEEAWAMALGLLEPAEREHGGESLEVAEILDFLAEIGVFAGKPGDVLLEMIRRSERIRETLQGADHDHLTRTRHIRAMVHKLRGEYREGIEVERRALAVREAHHGRRSRQVAESVYQIGLLQFRDGDREGAIQSFEEALSIREEKLGADHPQVALVLGQLAVALGDDGRAEGLLQRSLGIYERAFGPDSRGVGESYWGLAYYFSSTGRHTEAERAYERALALYERFHGPEHHEVLAIRGNLALQREYLGDLGGALRVFEDVLAISQRVRGPGHPDLAVVLTNLGALCTKLGRYELGRTYLERALALRQEKTKGHTKIGVILNNIGQILYAEGDLEGALDHHQKALAFYGPLARAEVETGETLDNIAEILVEQGKPTEARALLERSLALKLSVLEPEMFEPCITRALLGSLLVDQGEVSRGVELLEQATDALGKVAPEGYEMIDTLTRLGEAYRRQGRADAALARAVEAEMLARRQFRDATREFSEGEALTYGSVRLAGIDLALALVDPTLVGAPPASDRVGQVFDQLVRSRALVLDEMASRHPQFLGDASGETQTILYELRVRREALSRLALDRSPDPATRRGQLAEASAAVERAERKLAKLSAEFRARLGRFEIGADRVAGAIPARAALLSYARYRSPDGQERYLAFVQRSGRSRPEVLALGDAARIDGLVRRWRDELNAGMSEMSDVTVEAEERYRSVAEDLRRAIWDPISPRLAGREMVLVVPDGALHHLSLAILPVGKDSYLAEEGPAIHYLGAERDVVDGARDHGAGKGLLALGGPDFDRLPEPEAAASGSIFRGPRSGCDALYRRSFTPLPGARDEAREVAAVWTAGASPQEALVLTGPAAGEAEFKRHAAGRRILHLATHGFFASEACGSVAEGSEARGFDLLENPLLLSGLALAGANRSETAGAPDREDGMLTSQEIASLDLSGVGWVVLSACESGLGPIHGGEGVLGLQRAFRVAGARTLIMSLWDVQDRPTQEWMRELYKGRRQNLSTAEAVRRAHLRRLESCRRQRSSTHPALWGAFIAAGDWR